MYDNEFYSDNNHRENVDRPTAKPKKKSHIFGKIMLSLSLGLCFGLFAGLGFYSVQWGARLLYQEERGRTEAQEQLPDDTEQDTEESSQGILQKPSQSDLPADTDQITYVQTDVSDVVKEVMPAMVSIVNNYTDTGMTFWGEVYSQPAESSGSGIIVSKNEDELLIVSNNHVVEGNDNLKVTFIDGSEAEAVVKGLDSEMDLAVIAVPLDDLTKETKSTISVATLGDSDELQLGEPVIAIGNALGYGQSVSGGMVSALARKLTFDDGSTGTFIQTDAAINPGNSGGALLNLKGEVVGINSSKIGGSLVEGMGYAIPITSASPIIADLMERQTRSSKVDTGRRGYMGVSLKNVTEQSAQMYDMPQGAFVYEVEPDSAAEKAGIVKGDIIVDFDGQKITSAEDLQNSLQYYEAGETVKITVKRVTRGEYEAVELDITLGEKL